MKKQQSSLFIAVLFPLCLLLSACQPGSAIGAPASDRIIPTHLYVFTQPSSGQMGMNLLSVKPDTGHIVWQHALDKKLSSYGVATQDSLYLPTNDGNVYAFRARDGQPLWHTALPVRSVGSTAIQLLAYQNRIIASMADATNGSGDLYGFAAQTGKTLWHNGSACQPSTAHDCQAGERISLLANGVIYGLAEDGLSAWRATDGHFLWHNPTYLANGQPQALTVAHDKLYITNFYPEVDVLDTHAGHFLHRLSVPEASNNGGVVYDIAATQDRVFVLGGQTVSAYQASDDTRVWKQHLGYHSMGNVYAGSNGLYVHYSDTYNGKVGPGAPAAPGTPLYALSYADGHKLWQSNLTDVAEYSPLIEFKETICLSGLMSVRCLREDNGKQTWLLTNHGRINGLLAG